MNDTQRQYVEAAEAFERQLGGMEHRVSDVWEYLVGYFRTKYVMDELWDGEELKFRRSGKTLVTLYLKADAVVALVILGKAERDMFDARRREFSEYIGSYYDRSKTYHDGKWMFIKVPDTETAKEVTRLICMKKKPNRKPPGDVIIKSPCGFHCDACLFNKVNIAANDRREELTLGLAKCYGDISDHTQRSCDGCDPARGTVSMTGGCDRYKCVSEKGRKNCAGCADAGCGKSDSGVIPGRCPPGLLAGEVTDFIMPYVNKEL